MGTGTLLSRRSTVEPTPLQQRLTMTSDVSSTLGTHTSRLSGYNTTSRTFVRTGCIEGNATVPQTQPQLTGWILRHTVLNHTSPHSCSQCHSLRGTIKSSSTPLSKRIKRLRQTTSTTNLATTFDMEARHTGSHFHGTCVRCHIGLTTIEQRSRRPCSNGGSMQTHKSLSQRVSASISHRQSGDAMQTISAKSLLQATDLPFSTARLVTRPAPLPHNAYGKSSKPSQALISSTHVASLASQHIHP